MSAAEFPNGLPDHRDDVTPREFRAMRDLIQHDAVVDPPRYCSDPLVGLVDLRPRRRKSDHPAKLERSAA